MATLEYAKDVSLSVNDGGMTRVREKLLHADSIEELIKENLIPQYGSRHPENSRFRLTDGSIEQVGNSDSSAQWLFSGTYTNGAISGDGDIDPWDLEAQGFSVDRFTLSAPVFKIRNKQGSLVPFVNSAKCRMQAQRDIYGAEYSFFFCLKYKETSTPDLPSQPIINSATVKVAGETLPAYSSLLFPPSMRLVSDYEDDGTLKRSYWEISCKIRRHPHSGGWFEDYPDVGTLALDSSGKAAPIYRFSAWKNKEDKNNLQLPPSFGSIQEVIHAKGFYAAAVSGGKENETYWQAWQELPYEEITEPLPLRNGKVYLEAMADPVNYPYHQITGTVYQLGEFSQYDLPKKREG